MRIRFALGALALAAGGVAHAATIDWNQWDANTHGTIATGAGSVDVGFSGETGSGWYASYPSWSPAGTWADGAIVANAPTGGIVRLIGGNASVVDTITFSRPVVDPVLALWSVGQGGDTVSFDFNATPVLVAGGPSAEYGGSSIWVAGNSAYGTEGNGTVQFKGTFTSLSWVNPTAENWYGFNVGVAAAVPEPGSFALMLAGLALAGVAVRRRKAG
jgi:hypothetical protein